MTDYGDHTILVGRVVDARADEGARPLLYFRGGYHGLGERLAENHGNEER
jgi:flavin reductase (DIM6/NTAB) family NADH-FMN oxidoreductase RutF